MKQTPEQTAIEFEKLFSRPRNFEKLSASSQWEIDAELGILDVKVDDRNVTPEMMKRYQTYFQ